MNILLQSPHLIIFQSALFQTTTTLIIGENYLLLVDPNWLPQEVDFIYNFINKLPSRTKNYLLFTHSDYDHIIGYGKFKHFKTIASQNFIDNPQKNKQLQQVISWDDEYYIERNYPLEYPKIDIPIKGENVGLMIGSDEYVFNQAVGHNYDGLITFNQTKGILIVGDYLSNIEFPYIYESVEKYILVLNLLNKKITKEEVKVLITGHGDYTTHKQEMLHRIATSMEYIEMLKASVLEGKTFDFKKYVERYSFPIGMTKFHQDNLKLAKAEYS
ncbi:MAG: MBL fold metallo-hydrolase [Saprospiraceae bacterium]